MPVLLILLILTLVADRERAADKHEAGRASPHPRSRRPRAVYPLTLDPVIQNEEAKLTLTTSDGAAGEQFGFSVAVSGDTVVVGAPGDGDNSSNSGSAYVFELGP